jgi:hypothetical protein
LTQAAPKGIEHPYLIFFFLTQAAPKGIEHPYLMCHGDADPVVLYRYV